MPAFIFFSPLTASILFRNLKKLKPIKEQEQHFYNFFQVPTTDEIVKKIMTKHLGTYLTDDQAIAHILGLKQMKKASAKINPSETVSIKYKKPFIVTCILTLT